VYELLADRVAGWLAAFGRTGYFVASVGRALGDVGTWGALTAGQMRRVGVASVPIAVFIAAFTGIVLALQASYTFTGAVPLYFVGTLVGKTIMLELGPVLTGLALARGGGRGGGGGGGGLAAELGTMRVTEQVDALETLTYDPISYLVVPRVLAAALMFPVVVVLAIAVGVASGWLTAVNLLDLSTVEFVRGLRLFFRFKDVWFGLVKSASFGLTISLVGCIMGLSVDRGAETVGRATTRAVVLSAMLILVLDAFWAILLL
jgi:phospholipid/cholesterol/gamma-HCH transport system permease protein